MASSSLRSTRILRIICLALIGLGLLGAGWNLYRRVHAERSARAVDVVVDYADLSALANAQGMPLNDALSRMRAAGATAVALPEETLLTLEAQGQVTLTIPSANATPLLQESIHDHIWVNTDPVIEVEASILVNANGVMTGLMNTYPRKNIILVSPLNFLVRGTRETVGKIGLGLSPDKVALIVHAGLRVVPRLVGDEAISAQGIAATLAQVAAVLPPARPGRPRGIVIFDGKCTLGEGDLLQTTADALTANNLVYGAVEGGKQRGDAELGALLKGNLVRVHSIASEELLTLSPEKAIQRFGLAVKDRNIRLLYLHFPARAKIAPVENAAVYVHAIVHEITAMPAMGFTVSVASPPHPFKQISTARWVFALLFFGAGGALFYWLLLLLPDSWTASTIYFGYVVLGLGALAALGCALKLPALGRELFGLLAAVAFPLISLTWVYRRIDRTIAAPPSNVVGDAIIALLGATGITLLGALLVAATMVDSALMVQVGQFTGVKVALVLPLLLFAVLVAADGVARHNDTPASYWKRCRANVQAFVRTPLHLGAVVLGLLILGALGLMLLRSGNAGPDTTSGGELLLRGKLDQLLFARPRTKEFLIGFPLFLFSMVASANRKRKLALGLLLCAGIGQVDVLNTYCHAHTPILLSLLRTANGLLLGVILGVILLLIFTPRALTVTTTVKKNRDRK